METWKRGKMISQPMFHINLEYLLSKDGSPSTRIFIKLVKSWNSTGDWIFFKKYYQKALIYYGIRAGAGENSSYYKSDQSGASTRINSLSYWGPTIGGEYYLTGHFSLGGEIFLRYESGKNEKYNGEVTYESEETKLRIIMRFML